MKISFQEIIKFLALKKISYKLIGNLKENYKICSIFYPEPNGFYFLEEDSLSLQIKNSIILTTLEIKTDQSNSLIIIEESPQNIYYKLLDYYYREKPTGIISETAKIHKKAILGKNVQIDTFVVLGKCKIDDNSIIKSHTVINDNVFIGKNTIIEPGCIIGATGMAWIWDEVGERIRQPQLGGVLIEDNCTVGAQSVLVRGSFNENTNIGESTVIAPGARIGHGTQIGKKVHLANNVILAGNTNIGERSFLGSGCIISSNIKLPKNTIVGAGALVNKNFKEEDLTLIGVPAKVLLTKNHEQKSKGVPTPFKNK
jgi:UDP-3-O-[3-hydroxymyristoyl] glucosamine N-acyltransferase